MMKDFSCSFDTVIDVRSVPRRQEETSVAFRDAIAVTKDRIDKAFEQRRKFSAKLKNS